MAQFINSKESLVTEAIEGVLRSAKGRLARLKPHAGSGPKVALLNNLGGATPLEMAVFSGLLKARYPHGAAASRWLDPDQIHPLGPSRNGGVSGQMLRFVYPRRG